MTGKRWTCILAIMAVTCGGCARLSANRVEKTTVDVVAESPSVPEPPSQANTELMLESAQDAFVDAIHQYRKGQYELARQRLSRAIEQVIAADFLDPEVFDNRLKIFTQADELAAVENMPAVETAVVPVDEVVPPIPVQEEEDEKPVATVEPTEPADESSVEEDDVVEPVEPAVTYDLPVVINEHVKKQIAFFQQSRKHFQEAIDRSGRYVPLIKEMLRHEGLPEDLAYLALVESYFNPKARSRVGAAGIWQFMPKTAEHHGLEMDFYVDERYNVEKATYAAISYLSGLHELFKGDWLMAMAAYNMGEGGLLLRAALSAGTQDFWKLLEINPSRRYLPTETKQFVPRILAATVICKEPEKYGFRPSNAQPIPVDKIAIEGSLRLETLAAICGVSVDELRALNPELRRSVTPPQREPFMLTIPVGTRSILEDALAKLPAENGVHSFAYRVKRGDTLGRIAAQYNTTVEDIMAHNGLRNHIIRVGQSLVIPAAAAASTGAKMAASRTLAASTGDTVHVVEPGDSLWEIAREYGTTVTRLSEINGLYGSQVRRLRPGQKILVHRAPQLAARQTVTPTSPPTQRPSNYTVRRGDSLWSIAKQHGVAINDIVRWNSLGSKSGLIHPGDRLVIGDGS